MATNRKKTIFFVDDEPAIRKQVARTLAHLDAEVVCFAGAAQCLERLNTTDCDLLITDVKMPEMDGVELLTRVKDIVPSLPVLIITGYGDVPMAVRALKVGAKDFIEKPLKRESLLSAARQALESGPDSHIRVGKILTKTEKEVLRLILEGKTTREIADVRHRSRRTVEDHRTRIFRKLGVGNLVELLAKLGVVNAPDLISKL